MLSWLFEKTPLNYLVQSLWRDEAFSYLLAKKNLFQIFNLSAQDFSPPFYPILLKFWMAIFGSSEVAIRSLSLIAFLLTYYFFYMFLTKVIKTNKVWTVVYSLLFFINPFLNYYAFEARGYSLFSFFTIASFYYLYTKKKAPYLVITVLGLYTHYFMLLVVAAQGLITLLSNVARDEKKQILKTVGTSLLYFLPWILFFFLKNNTATDQFWIEKPTLKTLQRLPSILYFGFEGNFDFYLKRVGQVSLFLYGLIAAGSVFLWQNKKNRELLKIFLIWVFLPALSVYLVSLFKPLFFPRYLILTASGMILLLVFLIERMKGILKVGLVVVLMLLTLNYSNLQVKNRKKQPVRGVAREIKVQTGKNDVIYVTDLLNFHTAQYYFGEDRVYIYNKDYAEIPAYVGRVLIPRDKIAYFLPVYPKKAFILNEDLSYNIQAVF